MEKTGLINQLARLETSGLIQLVETLPELEYLFRHAMVQDAAYASLTKHDRRRLHLVIGEALEQTYPERSEELAGLLAHHFSLAGEAHKAIDYSHRAARRAAGRYAYDEAVQHLQNALELASEPAYQNFRVPLLEELADVYRLLRKGAAAIEIYKQALDLLQDNLSAEDLAYLQLHRKIVQTVAELKWAVDREHYDAVNQARATSQERLLAWLQPAKHTLPQVDTIRILRTLSLDAWRNQSPSDWEAARNYALRAVELANQVGIPNERSAALGALATAYLGLGQLQEYLDAALERLKMTKAPAFEHLHELLDSQRDAGNALLCLGQYHQALIYLKEAENLAVRLNAIDQQFNSLALQQLCYFLLDQWDHVLQVEERWRTLVRKFSREQTGPTCFPAALSASVRSRRGELDLAESLQQESYSIMLAVSGGIDRWLRNQFF